MTLWKWALVAQDGSEAADRLIDQIHAAAKSRK
jgi:hypothetical protein